MKKASDHKIQHAKNEGKKGVPTGAKHKPDSINHNILAIGAVVSIIALVLIFNLAANARNSDSLRAAKESRGSGTEGVLSDFEVTSSLQVPVDTGIYVCRTGDMSECEQFCMQVNLKPKRCMIKLNQQNLDSSLCACSASG